MILSPFLREGGWDIQKSEPFSAMFPDGKDPFSKKYEDAPGA